VDEKDDDKVQRQQQQGAWEWEHLKPTSPRVALTGMMMMMMRLLLAVLRVEKETSERQIRTHPKDKARQACYFFLRLASPWT
jgi:hypothetical protein